MSGRKLDGEERVLWGKVARTTRPMPGRLEQLLEFEEAIAEEDTPPPQPQKNPANQAVDRNAPKEDAAKPKGIHHPLEKPVKRKIARGRLSLEPGLICTA